MSWVENVLLHDDEFLAVTRPFTFQLFTYRPTANARAIVLFAGVFSVEWKVQCVAETICICFILIIIYSNECFLVTRRYVESSVV
jgi:hypothetical protein